jgi:hypothetical protein
VRGVRRARCLIQQHIHFPDSTGFWRVDSLSDGRRDATFTGRSGDISFPVQLSEKSFKQLGLL